ncbi:hypothetical protein F5Y11DRAFT_325232 [Daldinia sp. FL1419]|nr:hypothetical protein F5Y11DRAFT_325232 [Daldinia sp. FL1419]
MDIIDTYTVDSNGIYILAAYALYLRIWLDPPVHAILDATLLTLGIHLYTYTLEKNKQTNKNADMEYLHQGAYIVSL